MPSNCLRYVAYLVLTLKALEILHANGIVHADIKPDNIIVDSRNAVTLIDFGVSVDLLMCPTVCGRMGTLPYMAPEIMAGQSVTSNADIYSLGVVLAERVRKLFYLLIIFSRCGFLWHMQIQ